MANVSFLQNVGSAIFMNGNAYEFVQQTTGSPTNSTGDITTQSIGGITYGLADQQGKTIYTPGERALSRYEYGYGTSNVGSSGWPVQRIFTLQNRAPTVTDDTTDSHVAGYSRWLDITTGYMYVCSSASENAAVWTRVNTASSASPFSWGVFRLHGSSSFTWYLNGTSQGTIGSSTETSSGAECINMAPGDYISLSKPSITAGFTYSFLPFV